MTFGCGRGKATGSGDHYGDGYGKSREYEDGGYSSGHGDGSGFLIGGSGAGNGNGSGYDGDYERMVSKAQWDGSGHGDSDCSGLCWELLR